MIQVHSLVNLVHNPGPAMSVYIHTYILKYEQEDIISYALHHSSNPVRLNSEAASQLYWALPKTCETTKTKSSFVYY